MKREIISSIRKFASLVTALNLILSFFQPLRCQYPANYQYALLPDKIIDQIIGASSGDRAMKHIHALAPYTRPRLETEFPGNLSESNYIISKLKEYGIKDYSLDNVGRTTTWRGIKGTVWEISPGYSKIADFNDVPEMLAEGSTNSNVRARLIWAGEGQQSFFDDNKPAVKDKIVVTSGYPAIVHNRAVKAGAAGIISFYSSRPLQDPIQIPNAEIGGPGFAFIMPPREGMLLRDRLLRRENIEVEVNVESKTEDVDLLVPQCVIRGRDTTAGEVIFTAHLFEGYVKMGANDNMSGAAVILETARLLNNLIDEGKIERPLRSIRFLWVPEFSGTIPWVNSHLKQVKNAVCNLNLDMVGLRLRDSRSFFYLYRSGFSTAHYVNDVMESYYRYVGETNIESITDELGRRGFSRRIVSPTGTDDPFYYHIQSLHGSSDNAVFNNWAINIPGIKMGTWPDRYYHSSEDNPDKCDPTQLRRVIFISAAGAYTIALGGEETALRILSEMYPAANTRLGIQMAKASDMIWKGDAQTLASIYKRAVYNLEGFTQAEKSAIEKVRQVSSQPLVINYINGNREKLDNLLQLQLSSLKEQMTARCRILGIQPVEIKTDDVERNAMKIVPAPTEKALNMGYRGERQYISILPAEFTEKFPYGNIFNTDEVAGLADGKRNILVIKKMVDAQFETSTPLQDILNYFTVLREAGLMNF
jgi:hypothetical protein